MKKMFKKSIATLIAVLMVISAMPFTAITASAADSTEKAYVKQNINSFDGYKATGKYTYHGTDLSQSDSSYYSNVLYDDGAFNDGTEQKADNSVNAKIYVNNNVVLMFDGVSDTILPVVLRTWKTSSNNGTGNKYLHEISLDDANSLKSWKLQEDWKGGKGDSLGWPTGTDTVSYNTFNYNNSIWFDGKNTGYVWKNKLYYNGPQDVNASYEKLNNNITLTVHHTQWGISEPERKMSLSNTTSNVYVLNYAPIKQAIASMKAVYERIQATGEENYCPDSLEAFYQAAYQIMAFNPNDYVYQSDVEGKVNDAAAKINDIVTNSVPKATTDPTRHTLVDIPGKDATCGESGLTVGKKCSRCNTVTVAQTEIPATGEHDYVYTEKDSKVHTVTCKNCDYTTEEDHDIVGGKCTECGYIALGLSAYNAANDAAHDRLKNDADKYTEDSFNKYENAITQYLDKQNDFTTQDQVDDATFAIISAEVLLQKKKVTITFNICNDDTDKTTTKSETPAWGETVTLNAGSTSVSKWTVNVNGTTSVIASADAEIEHIATADATITAYVSNEQPDAKYSKVTFLGKSGAVVGIYYVKKSIFFTKYL